jgi:broad specificity phosphatase PhoE
MGDEMRIVLMRHGETDWNQEERIQGILNIALNERGRQQVAMACRLLSAGYEGVPFSMIISSPLERAAESARICSSILGVPVVETEFFRERSFGDLQGLTIADIRERYGMDIEEIIGSSRFGVESLVRVKNRVNSGLEQLKKEYSGLNVLVVTHGSIIKCTMKELGREVGIVGNGEFVVME